MAFHFLNPYKPLGFVYETCPQNLTYITDIHKNRHTGVLISP